MMTTTTIGIAAAVVGALVLAYVLRRGHDHAPHTGHMHGFAGAEAWAKKLDDPERDAWQRPDAVIRALAPAPSAVIADIGAGTGYFAVRIARLVPEGQVIATDLEPDMVRYLAARAQREHLSNLRAVQGTATSSGLAPNSVDAILMVHVWHHVGDKAALAKDLAAALRPGGTLVVVEFPLDAHRGPPADHRVTPEQVIAAFAAVGLAGERSSITLPEQYIVVARKP